MKLHLFPERIPFLGNKPPDALFAKLLHVGFLLVPRKNKSPLEYNTFMPQIKWVKSKKRKSARQKMILVTPQEWKEKYAKS